MRSILSNEKAEGLRYRRIVTRRQKGQVSRLRFLIPYVHQGLPTGFPAVKPGMDRT